MFRIDFVRRSHLSALIELIRNIKKSSKSLSEYNVYNSKTTHIIYVLK